MILRIVSERLFEGADDVGLVLQVLSHLVEGSFSPEPLLLQTQLEEVQASLGQGLWPQLEVLRLSQRSSTEEVLLLVCRLECRHLDLDPPEELPHLTHKLKLWDQVMKVSVSFGGISTLCHKSA